MRSNILCATWDKDAKYGYKIFKILHWNFLCCMCADTKLWITHNLPKFIWQRYGHWFWRDICKVFSQFSCYIHVDAIKCTYIFVVKTINVNVRCDMLVTCAHILSIPAWPTICSTYKSITKFQFEGRHGQQTWGHNAFVP